MSHIKLFAFRIEYVKDLIYQNKGWNVGIINHHPVDMHHIEKQNKKKIKKFFLRLF